MNLNLKLAIQEYLENGVNKKLLINQDNFLKFTEFNTFCEFTTNEENNLIEFSLSDFYESDIYHYFDLIDGTNHIVFNPEAYLKPMNDFIKIEFLDKWENDIDKKRVVITHANCSDGSGTAAVIKYHKQLHNISEDIEIIYLNYNSFDIKELVESVKGCLVYVGDFSFNSEQLDLLQEVVEDIVIVDHHKGAYDSEISNRPNVHVDLVKSGALLTYEFFFSIDYIPPLIISLISDRDLWNFFWDNKSKALQLLLKKEGYDSIMNYMSEDNEISYDKLLSDLEPYIKEVNEMEKKHETKARKFAKPYTLNNITLYGLNLTSSVSEVLNHVSKIFKTPSFAYWQNEDDNFQISFRNSDEVIPVNDLAKIIGGNGHTMASGSVISFKNLCLEEFFINKRIVIKYNVEDEETIKFFEYYGIHKDWVKNTLHCETIQTILNKTFHELFITERDNDQNIILKLKQGD